MSINRTTGTVTILGRDGGVAQLKAQLSKPSSSTHTIYVSMVNKTAVPTAPGTKYIAGGDRAGGGVVGYSGGGIVPGRRPLRAARDMVIPGYAPGHDTELSMLSKGEAVLVPELVRALGARRILAANAEASGGRPAQNTGNLASIMDGSIGRTTGAPGRVSIVQPRVTAQLPTGMAGSSIAGARAATAAMRGPVRGASVAGPAVQIQMAGVTSAVNALTSLIRADSMPPEATSGPIVAQLAALRSELKQIGPADRAGAARVRSALGLLA